MAVDVLARAYRRMQKIFQNIMAAIETLCLFPSRLRDHPKTHRKPLVGACLGLRTLENFAQEIDRLFSAPLGQANMLNMSEQMRHQFLAGLQSSQVNMLPSYTYALPTGKEKGTYLALDVGGSTFRVALVELRGRNNGMEILRVASSPIDNTVKLLEGTAFFDWLAERIDQMLSSGDVKYGRDSVPLVMGLSWSFPVEQTSIRSGHLIEMGKGFLCSDGTVGQDLNELIIQACRKRNLNLRLDAIVNDSSAALLSRAYDDPATRMSLILGTGTNMAIHFPVHALGITKFGNRPREWFDVAKHVIINTEMSMFGGGVLPMTRWDEYLNRTHLRPDYQPLEYMITGRYLGEIVRLIILEAAETAGLFGGELPHTLRNPYTLDTAIVASIEADSSASLSTSSAFLQKEHTFHLAPSLADMLFLRQVCTVVSQRAAAYLATGIHSLWCLRNDAEFATNPSVILGKDAQIETMEVSMVPEDDQGRNLTIACDGSVINKYPGFRERCQGYLEMLSQQAGSKSSELASTETTSPCIHLDPADESAILGAAVAVAVAAAQ